MLVLLSELNVELFNKIITFCALVYFYSGIKIIYKHSCWWENLHLMSQHTFITIQWIITV